MGIVAAMVASVSDNSRPVCGSNIGVEGGPFCILLSRDSVDAREAPRGGGGKSVPGDSGDRASWSAMDSLSSP